MKVQDSLALLPMAAVAAIVETGIIVFYLRFRGAQGLISIRGDRFLLDAQAYLLIACVCSYLWGRYWTRPLGKILEGISDYGKGKFNVKIARSKVKEMDALAGHLNEMAERLRELDRLKSDLIANVSHELRSPLAAMESYISLLLIQVHEPPKARENLERVGGNLSRIRKLVENLLDLSHLESKSFSPRSGPVRVSEALREVDSLFEAEVKDRRLRIGIDAPEGVPDANADPARLRQILVNLLDNAVKYNRVGGSIKLSIEWDARESRMLIVAVADSGCGIAADDVPRLFERFRRLPASPEASKIKGSGLGLAISRELARSMGGEITVESVLDQGSVFCLSLPIWEKP